MGDVGKFATAIPKGVNRSSGSSSTIEEERLPFLLDRLLGLDSSEPEEERRPHRRDLPLLMGTPPGLDGGDGDFSMTGRSIEIRRARPCTAFCARSRWSECCFILHFKPATHLRARSSLLLASTRYCVSPVLPLRKYSSKGYCRCDFARPSTRVSSARGYMCLGIRRSWSSTEEKLSKTSYSSNVSIQRSLQLLLMREPWWCFF